MQYSKVAKCGDRLKQAMEVRGIKAIELSKMTDINNSAISQYIKGTYEPKQDRIEIMAKALNVNEGWLMGLDVPMDKKAEKKADDGANFRLNVGEAKLVTLFREVPEADRDMVVKMIESALSARRVEKATDEIAANIARTAASVQRPRTFGMVRGRAGQRPAARGMQTAKERGEKQEAIYAAMRKVKK